MTLLTYSSFKSKIQNQEDIADEVWINETELHNYLLDAIKDAEQLIHDLHQEEKHFKRGPVTLTLVSGTADYALPSDIFDRKYLGIFYINGSKKYEILPLKDIREIPLIEAGQDYRYQLINTDANTLRLRLYPTPAENGAFVDQYYVRQANRPTTSSSATNVIDIPEGDNFIYAHVKHSIAMKSQNPVRIGKAESWLAVQRNALMEKLGIAPKADENNRVPMDLSAYHYHT